MSLTDGARTSVAARYRSRELSGDRRAGAWSRREVRRLQQQWLRKHWRVVAWIALGVVLACVLVEVFVPSQIRSYVVGALLASAAWWVYCLMITTGGLAGKMAGINAEVFTASELRRLCIGGWRLVNHVMFESRTSTTYCLAAVASSQWRPSFDQAGATWNAMSPSWL